MKNLLVLIAVVLVLAVSACSSDDTVAASSLPFTNGDGIAELTSIPVLPASLSTTDTTMAASFSVDSDTAKIAVFLHPVGDQNTTPAGITNQAVTASTTNTLTVPIVSSVTAGTVYYIELVTCASATATCTANSTFSIDTGYADTGTGTYTKFDMAQSNVVNTGVTIPTITAN